MRFATVSVLDAEGAPVWDGSAREFIRANSMTRDQVAEMVAVLRGEPGMPPEPYMVGGGAAPLFTVCLVEAAPACPTCGEHHTFRRVEREFCPHCDATNFRDYIHCIACGRSASEAAA